MEGCGVLNALANSRLEVSLLSINQTGNYANGIQLWTRTSFSPGAHGHSAIIVLIVFIPYSKEERSIILEIVSYKNKVIKKS